MKVTLKNRGLLTEGLIAFACAQMLIACSRSDGPEAASSPQDAGIGRAEVNVYSARHYDADRELFEAFTAKTGIRVNLIEANGDALIERLRREGVSSPADLFITADAGMLWRADSQGLLQPLSAEAGADAVPRTLRHPEDHWVALSKRARVIVYNKTVGRPEGLETYLDLARPDLKGTICVRSSSNVYNQSLLASIIAHHGAEAAEAWAKGVVANLARRPQGNDTSQIEAVAAGQCRVAIVNSYYLARYLGSDDPQQAAIGEAVGVIWPDQSGFGTHVNISGAGVTAHAPNRANAEALIRFLLEESSQRRFAEGNNEYPAVPGVEPGEAVARLGEFREDDLPAAVLGENQPEAVRIFDRAGWL